MGGERYPWTCTEYARSRGCGEGVCELWSGKGEFDLVVHGQAARQQAGLLRANLDGFIYQLAVACLRAYSYTVDRELWPTVRPTDDHLFDISLRPRCLEVPGGRNIARIVDKVDAENTRDGCGRI